MTITSKLILAAVAAALTGTFALQAQTITETTEPVTAGEVTIDPDVNYRPLDRIVAVVNNDVITEFELQNRVRQIAVNLRRQNIELPPMPQLRAQVWTASSRKRPCNRERAKSACVWTSRW